MSFTDCVEAAVQSGAITREQGEHLHARSEEATRAFTLDLQHSPESAARMGQQLGIERAKQDARLRKYQAALQAIRQRDLRNQVAAYPSGPTIGTRRVMVRDPSGRWTGQNVELARESILGQAHAQFANAISAMRTRWLGLVRNGNTVRATVREIFGATTGNAAAKAFANAWRQVAEDMRLRFNRSGGAIPYRMDWGMPQLHDQVKVGRVPAGEWVDFVRTRLDLDRMIDLDTGQPFTPAATELLLQRVYQTISTNGLADMTPGATGGAKLANRRQEARFLVFRDADTWLQYQERFGSPDLFGTMMDHFAGMARDIALLEVMGPNPLATFRYLQDLAKIAEPAKNVARKTNEGLYSLVAGTTDQNASPMVAHLFGAVRNWNVAGLLGGAALSAISDLGFLANQAIWSGLPVIRTFRRLFQQLNPLNEADRVLATRIGITALSWSEAYSNVGRFTEIAGAGGGATGRVSNAGAMAAEVTLRASGLNALTDGVKRAVAIEAAAGMAANFGRTLDQVPGNFGKALREAGFTAAEWDLLRKTPTFTHRGAEFFVVDELLQRTDIDQPTIHQLAYRAQQFLLQQQMFASPEADAATRLVTTMGGLPRGTIAGEVARTAFQFKSFPVAVISLQLRRLFYTAQMRGPFAAVGYTAGMIGTTTLLGALAFNLKRVARGEDPHDWEDPKLWQAGFLQGGGLGIFGDFIFGDVNRFGGGVTSTLLGPTAGMIDEVARMTIGNIQTAIREGEQSAVPDLIAFLNRYTPGGSIWYTRLVLEREVFDQLSLLADPSGTAARWRRAQNRLVREERGFWWAPGSTAPERLPNF